MTRNVNTRGAQALDVAAQGRANEAQGIFLPAREAGPRRQNRLQCRETFRSTASANLAPVRKSFSTETRFFASA